MRAPARQATQRTERQPGIQEHHNHHGPAHWHRGTAQRGQGEDSCMQVSGKYLHYSLWPGFLLWVSTGTLAVRWGQRGLALAAGAWHWLWGTAALGRTDCQSYCGWVATMFAPASSGCCAPVGAVSPACRLPASRLPPASQELMFGTANCSCSPRCSTRCARTARPRPPTSPSARSNQT